MIPTVDPQVKYVGSSWLRGLNAEAMKALSGAVVVQDGDAEPMVVILPYETYLRIQEATLDDFDERRKKIRESIARGARRTRPKELTYEREE